MTTTYRAGRPAGAPVNRIKNRIKPKAPAGGNGSNGNGHSNGNGGRLGNGKPAPRRPSLAELELLTQKWEAAKAAAKKHYAEADQIESALIVAVGVGGLLPLSDGRTLRVKDNFRDAAGNAKAKAFTVAGVKLAEIEVK